MSVRWMAVGVVVAALVGGIAAGAGWFVLGIGQDTPGDCGLGTGGLYPALPDESDERKPTVGSPAEARTLLGDRFDAEGSRLGALAGNETGYRYVPPGDVHPELREAVRDTGVYRNRLERDERLYYFLPEGGPADRADDGPPIVVTETGDVYVVRAGGC